MDRRLVLFIELTRVRGSTTSPEQREWIDRINALGSDEVGAYVVKGAAAAIEYVDQYLADSAPSGSPF